MPRKPTNPTVIINGVKLNKAECAALERAVEQVLSSSQQDWHKTLAGIQYTLKYIRNANLHSLLPKRVSQKGKNNNVS